MLHDIMQELDQHRFRHRLAGEALEKEELIEICNT
jgi:hypothetical protein